MRLGLLIEREPEREKYRRLHSLARLRMLDAAWSPMPGVDRTGAIAENRAGVEAIVAEEIGRPMPVRFITVLVGFPRVTLRTFLQPVPPGCRLP